MSDFLVPKAQNITQEGIKVSTSIKTALCAVSFGAKVIEEMVGREIGRTDEETRSLIAGAIRQQLKC